MRYNVTRGGLYVPRFLALVMSLAASAMKRSTKAWHFSHSSIGTSQTELTRHSPISGQCRKSVNRLPRWCSSAGAHINAEVRYSYGKLVAEMNCSQNNTRI